MDCKDYKSVRNNIKDGDIIAFRGTSILAKLIMYFDKAKYNHVGVAKWIGKRLFIVDMWYGGIKIEPVSRRMKGYKKFCIIRPDYTYEELIEGGIEFMLQKVEDLTKYDYFLLLRIAVYKKTSINLKRLGTTKRNICSELVQEFTTKIGLTCYKNINLVTPQDFIRNAETCYSEVLYDDYKDTYKK